MEEFMQQIHELKRSLALEKANQEYMTAELETIHSAHDQQKADLVRKHSLEIDKFRQQLQELKDQNHTLEDELQAEIRALKQQNEALKVTPAEAPVPASLDLSTTNFHLDQIQELQTQLQDTQDQLSQLTVTHECMQMQLQEKVACLEETLASKREQLEEREQTLEQYEDTIQELRSELMQLQTEPDATDCNKKGNSLFAEVIDQRQQVVQLLGAQNRSFKEMKRAYRQSEAEIRQLKEENSLMVREIGKIKTIFLSANKAHTEQLNKRIADLHRDMDKQKKKAQFLEGQVQDGKVEAVMKFYRNEGESMRQELSQSRMQKCEMEDQLQAAQEELARWRFQCLRQKCVLIDREMRLEANSIPFESRCSVPVDESVHIAADDDVVLVGEKRPAEVDVGVGDSSKEEAEVETEGNEMEVSLIQAAPIVVVKEEALEVESPVVGELATDDGDCEIVEASPASNQSVGEGVIDLSVEEGEKGDEEEETKANSPQVDMSLEMPSTAEGETKMKDLTTSVSSDSAATEAKQRPEKTRLGQECLVDLDFLLDSPGKASLGPPVPPTPSVIDLCSAHTSPVVSVSEGDSTEENKENEGRQQKRKSTVTKLNFKAISNTQGAKSILVKRHDGVHENHQKNVQFATDVQEDKGAARGGFGSGLKVPGGGATVGGVFVKQEPSFGQPKKAFKVNFRRIHSKPTPVAGEGGSAAAEK